MANVLLISLDVVGPAMAGPGVRYWELAHQLSAHHTVTLAAPQPLEGEDVPFDLIGYAGPRPPVDIIDGFDACMCQLFPPKMAARARRLGVRLVLDAYDPLHIEELAAAGEERHTQRLKTVASWVTFSLLVADSLVCASERQRDLWLGALSVLGRLDHTIYGEDPAFRSTVGVVPFGLPEARPERTGPGLRDRLGLAEDDFVILWGGGIWNWFDPLTLIEASVRASASVPDLRVVFLGTTRPGARPGKDAMAMRAQQLAVELDPRGEHVIFNSGWVPYQERQNFLLDADVGVSTHLDHLEARFAFRTRLLDYLWCALPMLVNDGDEWAEIVRTHDLGLVVECGNKELLEQALVRMATDEEMRARYRENGRHLAAEFTWERAARPLVEMLEPTTVRLAPLPAWQVAAAGQRLHLRTAYDLAWRGDWGRLTQAVRNQVGL